MTVVPKAPLHSQTARLLSAFLLLPCAPGLTNAKGLARVQNATSTVSAYLLEPTQTSNHGSSHTIRAVPGMRDACIGTVHTSTIKCILYSALVIMFWALFAVVLRSRSRPRLRDAATSPTRPRALGGALTHTYGGVEHGAQAATVPVNAASNVERQDEEDVGTPHVHNAMCFFVCLAALAHCQKTTGHWEGNVVIREFVSTWCTRGLAFLFGMTAQDLPCYRSIHHVLFTQALPLVFYCAIFEPLVLPLIDQRWYSDPTEVGHRVITNLMFATAGATSFVFGLILWRIWGWMLMTFRVHWRLPVALAVSAVAGYSNMESFKLGQALAAFPVFAAGQLFPYDFVVKQLPLRMETVGFGVLLLAAFFFGGATPLGSALLLDVPSWGWSDGTALNGGLSHHCGEGEAALLWMRGFFRNAVELSKTLLLVFFVCPRQRLGGITAAGTHFLYPYLLQYAATEVQNVTMKGSLKNLQVPEVAWVAIWAAELGFILLLVVLLGSWPVRFVFGALFEPRWVERLVASGESGPRDMAPCMPSSVNGAPLPVQGHRS